MDTTDKLTTAEVFALPTDEYGWRTLPNGRRVKLTTANVEVANWASIGDRASIGDGASIGDEASIGNWASIGDEASIGNRARIGDEARIGNRASIGNRARIGNWARIGDEASIGNWARIGDEASIGDGARIPASKCVLTIDFLGSRGDTLTAILNIAPILISTGCFRHKSLSDFEQAVSETHGDNAYAAEYRAAIAFIRATAAARFPELHGAEGK